MMFEEFVGEVVDGETIQYVAKIPSAARRVRELRDEARLAGQLKGRRGRPRNR
jgi:hypothetical protein